jgi:hypothetical protein
MVAMVLGILVLGKTTAVNALAGIVSGPDEGCEVQD